MNKILLVFSITYTLITLAFISNIYQDQSATLGYIFIFPVFWIIAAIALILLFKFKKVNISSWRDSILVFFSTPVPVIIFLVIKTTSFDGPVLSNLEYIKDRHLHKEIKYEYSVGDKIRRVEYYISQDIINDSTPMPSHPVWLKDSIWIYYKKDGTIEKKEDYRAK
jgi:hypothetical protein